MQGCEVFVLQELYPVFRSRASTQYDIQGENIKYYETMSQVLVAIGGKGLPKGVEFAQDVEDPGLTNVSATILNLLGFEAPSHMRPTLLA